MLSSGLLLVSAGLRASAAEPQKKKEEEEGSRQKKGQAGAGAVVYTNADLERLFGPPGPAPAEEAGSKQETGAERADPLKLIEEEKQQASDRQAKIAAAEKAVADAEANVRDLEKRILAVRNPLLPRPKLSEEEEEAQKGMDGAERVKRSQEQLEQARKEVDRAKAELARVR